MEYDEYDGTEAIGQLRKGDRDYLARFYEEYRPHVKQFFRNHGRDSEQADDLTQTVFVRFISSVKYKPLILMTDVERLMYAKAKQVLFNDTRSRMRAQRKQERMEREPLPEPPQPDEVLDSKVTATTLHEAMERLPDRCRETAELRWIEGKTVEETALATGVSTGTVKTRSALARKLLYAALMRKQL